MGAQLLTEPANVLHSQYATALLVRRVLRWGQSPGLLLLSTGREVQQRQAATQWCCLLYLVALPAQLVYGAAVGEVAAGGKHWWR